MQFLRFTLDVSPLDDTGYGLDGEGFAFTEEGVGASSLGALTSAASSEVTHNAVLVAPLNGATATATSLVTNPVSANAPLGGTSSTANAIVSVIASGGVSLGGLTATARASDTIRVTAQAALGGLYAHIQAVPANEGGSFGPGIAYVQPNFVLPQVETPIIEPILPKVQFGFADALLGRTYASALSQIDFSIVEDDAEILAMM